MILTVQTIIDLAWLLKMFPPGQIEAEHRAIHVNRLDESIENRKRVGFELIKQTDTVAFVKRAGEIHELILSDYNEHEAYVVTEHELLDIVVRKK